MQNEIARLNFSFGRGEAQRANTVAHEQNRRALDLSIVF
jgi:hypothetical protein